MGEVSHSVIYIGGRHPVSRVITELVYINFIARLQAIEEVTVTSKMIIADSEAVSAITTSISAKTLIITSSCWISVAKLPYFQYITSIYCYTQ